ncbi:Peripherin-2 [Amphibalanus amphitrite]|uniref:Peripherin-2 n=1 Tax=Amphibalanus amphitrite TaxID=1232801 RepID=A0A6A4V8I1_AMPAM|nr:Peripherin-2 [Amphibalanus amphitrite]
MFHDRWELAGEGRDLSVSAGPAPLTPSEGDPTGVMAAPLPHRPRSGWHSANDVCTDRLLTLKTEGELAKTAVLQRLSELQRAIGRVGDELGDLRPAVEQLAQSIITAVGLALLALSFYVRPYLQRHHLVTGQKVNSDLFPYGLIAASAATLISRQRRKTGRRAAVQFGYFYLFIEFATTAYLLAIGIVFILQLDSFQAAYQRGFSRAMWRYMQSQPLKEYLDGVQQDFGCCGALGFSDWFVVDWYPRDLYSTRYRTAAKQRSSLAKKVAKAMDYEFVHGEYTSALLHMKTGVPFAEVPFSCCDPSAPTWCHQMYATYPWYNYEPTRRLSIHTVGCTYKVLSLLVPVLCGTQTLGRGRWRHNLRLRDAVPLSEHHVASVVQCLALCGRQIACKALQYESLPPGQLQCQLFDVSACEGPTGNESRLVAAQGVHYMDVSSDLSAASAERQQNFWEDAGCTERGYCDPACAAAAEGDFCPASDAFCSAIQPATCFACLENSCQLSPTKWRVAGADGPILPRWQPWLLDTYLTKIKRIVNGACSLKFDLRVQKMGSISITVSNLNAHKANGRDFGDTAYVFDIGVNGNSETVLKLRTPAESIVLTASTPDILSATEERRYLLSFCDGQLRFGPEPQPDLVTSSHSAPNGFHLLLLDISPEAEVAHMKFEKDVADSWLLREDGVIRDAKFDVPSKSVLLRQLSAEPIAETSISFAVQSPGNTWVMFRQSMDPGIMYRVVLGATSTTSRLEVVTLEGAITVETITSDKAILISSMPVSFKVTYRSTVSGVEITVERSYVALFQSHFPEPMLIRYVAVGAGCCGIQWFNLGRHHDGWRTDFWVTQGSGGYVNYAGLE